MNYNKQFGGMIVNGQAIDHPQTEINPNLEITLLKQRNQELMEQITKLTASTVSRSSARPRLRTIAPQSEESSTSDNNGVSLEQYNTLKKDYEALLAKLDAKDLKIENLEKNITELKTENQTLKENLEKCEEYINKQPGSKAMEKSAIILAKAVRYKKTPAEIIVETGFSKTTVYNALSVTKKSDKERIKALYRAYENLFDGVDINAWYESQLIKRFHLLTYNEVMRRTGYTYRPEDKAYAESGYIYINALSQPVFKYQKGSE